MNSSTLEILNNINKDNILYILDQELRRINNQKFSYSTNEEYIISNIMSLRWEAKLEKNIEMCNKINNFLINNVNDFKAINVDVICKSPYFEKQIEMEKINKEEEETDELVDGIETCKKCKSKKIFVKYVQTRSGDEG